MPQFKVKKVYEFVVDAEDRSQALEIMNKALCINKEVKCRDWSVDWEVNQIEEPIEVAYTGWETLIRQGIDEWKFEYEIGSLELYVDGDLYHLDKLLHTYHDFVEHAKNFVKGV